MYSVKVINNYIWAITASDGAIINEKGGTYVFGPIGNLILSVKGIGDLSFIDLAKNKIPGYPIPKEYWGVLVRYQTTEAYYRYEGAGQLTLTIDVYGGAAITTSNGTMIEIKLPELTIN
ncbi:MAG: hypothetical protein ACWA45_02695 [Flavobacteriales bacterium]